MTQDQDIAARLRALRQYGWSRKYEVVQAGGCNSRLDEIQAAVLRAKLPHLDRQNAQRRAIAKRYNDAFAGFTAAMVNADLSETTWCAYAWPVNYQQSGNRTFFTNQGGDVHQVD